MRSLILFIFISLFCFVLSKNNVKTLSENMGQEVIEIGGPKELPPGVEEEPSADPEDDDDDIKSTSPVTTKRDSKKSTSTTVVDARKKLKDVEKIDGVNPEDEEARLEKELAEIYKDTDYKDSAEETTEVKETTTATTVTVTVTDGTDKPIGRQRNSFKFAPDSTNKKDVEKFRTSVDDIICKNRQKLSATVAPSHSPSESDSAPTLNMAANLYISLVAPSHSPSESDSAPTLNMAANLYISLVTITIMCF